MNQINTWLISFAAIGWAICSTAMLLARKSEKYFKQSNCPVYSQTTQPIDSGSRLLSPFCKLCILLNNRKDTTWKIAQTNIVEDDR